MRSARLPMANIALLAFICAAHVLLGLGLWAYNPKFPATPTNPIPTLPSKTLEVLLLPSQPLATQPRPQATAPSNKPHSHKTQDKKPNPSAQPKAIETKTTELQTASAPKATELLKQPNNPELNSTNEGHNNNDDKKNGDGSKLTDGRADGRNSNQPERTGSSNAPLFSAAYLNNPSPAYPALSRQFNEQGRVLLRVYVGTEGQVLDLEIQTSSGFTRLDKSARDTVQRWRFVPAQQDGQAIPAWVLVPIAFSLKGTP